MVMIILARSKDGETTERKRPEVRAEDKEKREGREAVSGIQTWDFAPTPEGPQGPGARRGRPGEVHVSPG